jgi:hypothetical protein
VNDPDYQRDGDSEPCTERDEVPQCGKSEDENNSGANGKQETDESAADGKLVHVDAGMTVLRHNPPLTKHLPTNLIVAQAASMQILGLFLEMYRPSTPSGKAFTAEFAEKGR